MKWGIDTDIYYSAQVTNKWGRTNSPWQTSTGCVIKEKTKSG